MSKWSLISVKFSKGWLTAIIPRVSTRSAHKSPLHFRNTHPYQTTVLPRAHLSHEHMLSSGVSGNTRQLVVFPHNQVIPISLNFSTSITYDSTHHDHHLFAWVATLFWALQASRESIEHTLRNFVDRCFGLTGKSTHPQELDFFLLFWVCITPEKIHLLPTVIFQEMIQFEETRPLLLWLNGNSESHCYRTSHSVYGLARSYRLWFTPFIELPRRHACLNEEIIVAIRAFMPRVTQHLEQREQRL